MGRNPPLHWLWTPRAISTEPPNSGATHFVIFTSLVAGIVFKLDPTGHETVLHTFTGTNGDAGNPFGLIRDSAGNLYGTTSGTVFKVDPAGHETILYLFTGSDGSPNGALILDSAGNLYGTAQGGGTHCVSLARVAAPFSSSIPPDTKPCSTPSQARTVMGRPPLACWSWTAQAFSTEVRSKVATERTPSMVLPRLAPYSRWRRTFGRASLRAAPLQPR